MADTNNLQDRVLTITRTFNAPRKLVWEVWTQPEHIAQWWGPTGMETRVEEQDFKVGGNWKYVMTMPNGQDFVAEGTYTEIEDFAKIVTGANFRPMTEGVTLSNLFEDEGAGTKITFDVIHPTAEYAQQQKDMGFEKGWGSHFDRMQEYVSTLA
ncbi:MAG: activator of HSP90 ATPase [Roseivirga sp.]|nr:activator of HSP90 ATPase [Roseivirga sp.]